MARPRSSQISKHTASFLYQGDKIFFDFYVKPETGVAVDTVLFLGTGQVGKITRWVAANAPAGVAVVEGLPHWKSNPDGSDLVAFSLLYTKSAYEAVLKEFMCTSMHIIGSSQAAPGMMWLANSAADKIRNIAFILPMGLNTTYFGSNDEARFRELQRRALRSLIQKDQLIFGDIRNAYIALNLLRVVAIGIGDGSTVKKYTTGISEDMTAVMRQLAASQKALHRKLLIYVGAQDKIFPPDEVRQTLSQAGIHDVTIITVPGISHGSLAIRKSKALLAQVVRNIRS